MNESKSFRAEVPPANPDLEELDDNALALEFIKKLKKENGVEESPVVDVIERRVEQKLAPLLKEHRRALIEVMIQRAAIKELLVAENVLTQAEVDDPGFDIVLDKFANSKLGS